MLVNSFKRLVFIEQNGSRCFTYGGHSGDVVRSVAYQGLKVRLLRCREPAVAFRQLFLVNDAAALFAAGQVHPHARRYQLESIPVAGQDHRFDVGGLRLPRQRPDDVVGLPTRQFVHRHGERRHQLLDPVELRTQLRRTRWTLRLVFGEPLVPERGGRRVERHGHVGGLPFVQRAQKHAGEPVHSGNVLPRRRHGEAAADTDGAERTVHHGVPVNQQQERVLSDGASERHRHGHLAAVYH